jgi:hypothetical protein
MPSRQERLRRAREGKGGEKDRRESYASKGGANQAEKDSQTDTTALWGLRQQDPIFRARPSASDGAPASQKPLCPPTQRA